MPNRKQMNLLVTIKYQNKYELTVTKKENITLV